MLFKKICGVGSGFFFSKMRAFTMCVLGLVERSSISEICLMDTMPDIDYALD